MPHPSALTLSVGVVALAVAGSARAQTTYEVIDLGFSTGDWSGAVDVNDDGLVVGTLSELSGIDHPFSWQDGVLTMLPKPEGTDRAAAKRVSETGVIVGWASPSGRFLPRPLVWQDGQPMDIGTLGGDDGGAMGVSPDGGRVIGWARPNAGTLPGSVGFRAFLWDGSAMRDLGTLPVGHWSSATDANDAGQIIGASGSKNDSGQPVLFDPERGVIHLGTLGGLGGDAVAINASGQIVGRSDTGAVANDFLVMHAFIWTEGAMTDLGVLPGDHTSWGLGINDAGVAVGCSINTAAQPWGWRGFVWEDGQMRDLNDQIDSNENWVITSADGVNNNGWIAGRASLDGVVHAVLLRPLP